MIQMRRTNHIILITVLIIIVLSGCEKDSEGQNGLSMENISFRDVPGVTMEEIAAIEALQRRNAPFVYGITPSTESFETSGVIGGFSPMLCEWLSGLLGIPFKPAICEWGDLIAGLQNGTIDFSGDLSPSEGRRSVFFMTDTIALRTIKYIRIKGSNSLSEIEAVRPLRLIFFDESITYSQVVSSDAQNIFEALFVSDNEAAYNMLKKGEADALIAENVVEADFDFYGDVVAEDYLPLLFSPVSMATAKPEFEPIISVVDKALKSGGTLYLNELYKIGQEEYRKHKLFLLLSDEEKVFMQNPPVVPISASNWLYPICFYNKYEKQWEGIAFDILDEVTKISGINFEIVNSADMSWAELYEMIQDGKVSICLDLICTPERRNRYLWSNYPYLSENYALLSKIDFPNISTGEIHSAKTGLIKSTGYADMFQIWFPDATNVTMYETQDDAFNGLDKGEVDLVMAGTNVLLSVTNYYELSNYKANYIFESVIDFSLAFNIDQRILYSIIEKTLSFVNIKTISKRWESKTFDYHSKLIRAQRPWLIGAIALSLTVLALVFVLLVRSRYAGKRLEGLVKLRTGELELRTEEARMASNAKSAFLANMSHEMRTPMNVVVGLTDLMIEEEDPTADLKENLRKISTAGNTLLGLINDVLDISKIEAGRLELMLDKYEIPSLLSDITTLNMIRIESKPIALYLDIDGDLPYYLYGDDLRVKQIINNLLGNALKYTQRGLVTFGMKCSSDNLQRSDGRDCSGDVWVSAYVSDTGIGIREEDLKKLFLDYSQVDTRANRRIEGTGLGLSITRMLVEQMGGEISVESEYGKGSTFRFKIRQGFVSDKTIGQETAEYLCNFRYLDRKKRAHEKIVRPDLNYASVLVVDDMQTNLDVAAGMLRKYKMRVDCVLSGQEAIDRIDSGKPVYDAIFMDHMMPGMDGLEAAKRIRDIGTRYAMTIPIIALTANAIAGNEQMFLNNDFQAFLAKPINIIYLDAVVKRWVRDKTRE